VGADAQHSKYQAPAASDEKSMGAPLLACPVLDDQAGPCPCPYRTGHHPGLFTGAYRTWEELFFLLFFNEASSPSSESPETDKSWKGEAGKATGAGPPEGVKHCQDNDHLASHTQGYRWHQSWDQEPVSPGSDWQELWGFFLFFCSKGCDSFYRVEGKFYLIISLLCHD